MPGIKNSRFSLILLLLICLMPFSVLANNIHLRIMDAQDATQPVFTGNKIIFSYSSQKNIRMVALAFEHEQYRQLHVYKRNPNDIFTLSLDIPGNLINLHYRIVVDGFWTIDPHAESFIDPHGIRVSSIEIPMDLTELKPGVHWLEENLVRFVYHGRSGSRVAVIGDFNRWDPFLSPMNESLIQPGVFTADILLPPEASFYRLVVNGKEIIDPGNPKKARNGWGELASILKE